MPAVTAAPAAPAAALGAAAAVAGAVAPQPAAAAPAAGAAPPPPAPPQAAPAPGFASQPPAPAAAPVAAPPPAAQAAPAPVAGIASPPASAPVAAAAPPPPPAQAAPAPVAAAAPPPPPPQQQAEQQFVSQLQQQMQSGSFIDKRNVLAGAQAALNRPGQPWLVSVSGDSIIGFWDVQNPEFFNPLDLTDDEKTFTFTVTLSDKGTWKESDEVKEKSSGVSLEGGKLSFGKSSDSFKGRTNQKSFEFGIGRKPDGSIGMLSSRFDTSLVKEPIRSYLTACGYKKAGLFG